MAGSDPQKETPVSPGRESTAVRRLARAQGVECVEIVTDDMLDPALVADLPVEWARSNHLLPVRWQGGVRLLTADAAPVQRQEEVALLLGTEVRLLLAPRAVIDAAIERCYYRKGDSAAEFLKGMDGAGDGGPTVSARASEDLLKVSEEAPITQLVNLILLEAVKARASDIHFEPFESRFRVRYRIDGVLYEQSAPPKHLEAALVSRLKVMAHMDIAERRLPQDGMAKVRVGAREIDIRVSTVPVAEGERVVLRLLDRDSALLPLAALGVAPRVHDALEGFLRCSYGLLVVSGPTGSGKTTTLYALLGRIDTDRRNVMTIEDPIEYQLPAIGQIQVYPKIGLTFAVGLRHILRQDPDAVLVGETRDHETAEIAIRASLTGHLVFTTLHTNDAASAVVRMTDMGVEPYLLAAALRGVVAQRLVRRLCPECRQPAPLAPADWEPLGLAGRRLKDATVGKAGPGCRACREGYHGRIGLFEMLTMDAELHERVRRGDGTASLLRRAAAERSMPTLADDAVEKVIEGMTSLEEVLYAVGWGPDDRA